MVLTKLLFSVLPAPTLQPVQLQALNAFPTQGSKHFHSPPQSNMLSQQQTLSGTDLCPGLVSVAVIIQPKAMWEEKLIPSYSSSSSWREVVAGTWRQELADAEARVLLLTCSPCLAQRAFFQNPGPSAQGVTLSTVGQTLQHNSSITKFPHRLDPRPVWWRHCLT